MKLSDHDPTPGRPQGSHPLILTTPALTKTTRRALADQCLCKGGGRVVRSGDPCGRLRWGAPPRIVRSLHAYEDDASVPTHPPNNPRPYAVEQRFILHDMIAERKSLWRC